jgi:uncharacterized protein
VRNLGPKSIQAILDAIAAWAIVRDDIRGMALLGSWARGNPGPTSDIDIIFLSNRSREYRNGQSWLSEIDFPSAGYRVLSRESADYGAVWSQHVHLAPATEVELTFASCSWAATSPIDDGTQRVVRDGLRIIFDKDNSLASLVEAAVF